MSATQKAQFKRFCENGDIKNLKRLSESGVYVVDSSPH